MTLNLNPLKMNITDKFDLYFENKLSKSEKMKFESELNKDAELYESYKAYFQINRVLENELTSPAINYESDPILKDLNSLQRLEIEETFIRFHDHESANTNDKRIPNPNRLPLDRTDIDTVQTGTENTNTGFDEVRFRKTPDRNPSDKTPGKFKTIGPFIGIAAAVAISFFSIKTIYTHNFSNLKKIDPQQAYALYFSPGTDNELNSLNFDDNRLNSAFLDLKRSKSGSDAIFSNQMKVSDEDYEISLMFLGLIYMERNDFPEARKCFTHILSLNNPKKSNSASFYLSLSYLSEGKLIEAEPIFIKLRDTKNPYQKKAKSILKSVYH
jgi:tetratricopeptide (TPR) repeat protein